MSHSQENDNTIYAGFFVRLAAYLIDSLLIGAVLLVVRVPMFFVQIANPELFFLKPLLFQFSLYDIILYLAASAYFILLTYQNGSTIGKRLMNLKVVSEDGAPLTLLNVLYRETIGRYLSSILFIGYIMIGASSEKRGLHDFLCNTRVVYTCKCIPVPAASTPYRTVQGYGTMYGYGQYARPSETPTEPQKTVPGYGTMYGYGQYARPSETPTEPQKTVPGYGTMYGYGQYARPVETSAVPRNYIPQPQNPLNTAPQEQNPADTMPQEQNLLDTTPQEQSPADTAPQVQNPLNTAPQEQSPSETQPDVDDSGEPKQNL